MKNINKLKFYVGVLFAFILFIFTFQVRAEVNVDSGLQNLSNMIGEKITEIIPGEGVTEVNFEIKEEEKPDFTILALRDIAKADTSNFFTQLGLHNNEISDEDRWIANLGLGYRKLSSDESIMWGINSFFDWDIDNNHSRASLGLEARGSILEFNTNIYEPISLKKTIDGVDEQSLGGIEYTLKSQLPYTPWAKVSWTGYKHNADAGTSNLEGEIISLEVALNPSLELEISRDNFNDNENGGKQAAQLNFIYPPREDKPSFLDGRSADMFEKISMKHALSDKVERNNNLIIELQGAVVITKAQ